MNPDEIAERTASAIAAWLKAEAAKTRAAARKYFVDETDLERVIAKADALDQAALDVARGAWLP